MGDKGQEGSYPQAPGPRALGSDRYGRITVWNYTLICLLGGQGPLEAEDTVAWMVVTQRLCACFPTADGGAVTVEVLIHGQCQFRARSTVNVCRYVKKQ